MSSSVKTMEFLSTLAQYQGLFAILSLLFLFVALGILLQTIISRSKNLIDKKLHIQELNKHNIKNMDYSKVSDETKGEILRKVVAPDAINPGPNSYMILEDGGKELFVRTFTIASMPKNTTFARTFSELFDFPGCTSSVFIKPISEASITSKMDRQITVISSEIVAAQGDPNRTRKLSSQYKDIYTWADEVESGDNKFYEVGFLFGFYAESVQELNKISDTFRSMALGKSIVISNCYAVEAEAFHKNSIFNQCIQIGSKYIRSDGVKYFQMDRQSVSTVFNYTQGSFSHKDGVILGRDIDTHGPVFYDIFDPSHDGFTLVMAGKTGSGKSATIKIYATRTILYDYRYVCVDSQQRKGTNEGEFAALAELVNGVNFKISNNSECIMNPFEVSESSKTVKESHDSVREVITLDLNDKISMVVHTLLTMLQGSKEFVELESIIPVTRILTDAVTSLYGEFGIIDGDAESLYEEGNVVVDGNIARGKVRKKLPTLTDFYKKILVSQKANNDSSLEEPYNLVVMGLKDFVKELYFTSKSLTFLTRTEVEQQRFRDRRGNARTYRNANGEDEEIIAVKGIRAYFDGQSNIHLDPNCPFTNIDISLLPENEKVLARQIAIDFVNESFIKKNSESIKEARKLVAIFDECHENFALEYARKTLDNVVRTARKRNCALILSSQTLAEYQNWPETQAILKQATTKLVFKQDVQDKDYLLKTLGITESQVNYIVNVLGGSERNEDDQGKHRGEMCIVDNKKVCFCKVDYLKETEKLAVETDAKEVEKMLSIS